MDSYFDATEKQYGYIRVDSSPDNLPMFRIQSRITPEELSDKHTLFYFTNNLFTKKCLKI